MGRAALMVAIGVFVARLVWSGGYGSFVQEKMRIPLALSALLLLVFGVIEGVAALRQESRDSDAARRSISPTVGWLLAAPLVVLTAVAPTALGAAAAQRSEPLTPTERSTPPRGLPEIDDSEGPADLRVYEFLSRALWDETASLTGKEIALEGIVVNDPDIPDGFRLTRFAVNCCAADGLPLQVAVRGVTGTFDDDEWVRAVVTWRPPPGGSYLSEGAPKLVEADVISIEIVDDPPSNPYETPF
ncbi:MAG: TIGR03943 family putative permease subunit [Ilumatobacter sp.]|jgi:uncharacterized repeat protein (TIGR03943 family)|uniref:TIGR03943 family putative permease subunit n=1 Tax=Ilumatobacter sp. TaxID=1967498 RepID=UPI003918E2D2